MFEIDEYLFMRGTTEREYLEETMKIIQKRIEKGHIEKNQIPRIKSDFEKINKIKKIEKETEKEIVEELKIEKNHIESYYRNVYKGLYSESYKMNLNAASKFKRKYEYKNFVSVKEECQNKIIEINKEPVFFDFLGRGKETVIEINEIDREIKKMETRGIINKGKLREFKIRLIMLTEYVEIETDNGLWEELKGDFRKHRQNLSTRIAKEKSLEANESVLGRAINDFLLQTKTDTKNNKKKKQQIKI